MKRICLKKGAIVTINDKSYLVNSVNLMSLSSSFVEGCVCNNEIIRFGDWELLKNLSFYEPEDEVTNGDWDEDEEDVEDEEVMNFFVISESDAMYLTHSTQELVFFNSEFDMYLWGVTCNDDWNNIFTPLLKEV